MSKKNLLNESQIRQFMKLARLEPLTPGFVSGLTERAADPAPDEKDLEEGTEEEELEESHGRGREEGAAGYGHPDQNSRLEEEEGELDRELGATEDELGAEDREADEEGEEIADLEADEEGPLEDGAARTVSVDDFLAALESTLEQFLDQEVEVDSSEMEDEEEAAPEEEDEFAPAGDEVVADVELGAEEEMMEEGWEHPKSADGPSNTHKGSKQHPDHRRKKVSAGGLASQGPGLVKEEDDEDLEEGVFGGKDYEKMAKGKKGSYAPDPEAGEKDYTPTPEEAAQARAADKARGPTSSRDKFPRRHSGGGGGMKIGGITAEGQDDLVEQITKRVAARILKSALAKK